MCYKDYVDSLFNTTNLDRNQIMRLALYVLGHTSEGLRILEEFQKDVETPIPLPSWELLENWDLWLGRKTNGVGERNVKDKLNTDVKPKSQPIKIHGLSYTILSTKENENDESKSFIKQEGDRRESQESIRAN